MSDETDLLKKLVDQISAMGARDLVTSFIIKFLIAEIATVNRSPQEANIFVSNIRVKLEDFSKFVNQSGSDYDLKFQQEMLEYAALLMNGISFDQADKR